MVSKSHFQPAATPWGRLAPDEAGRRGIGNVDDVETRDAMLPAVAGRLRPGPRDGDAADDDKDEVAVSFDLVQAPQVRVRGPVIDAAGVKRRTEDRATDVRGRCRQHGAGAGQRHQGGSQSVLRRASPFRS